MTETQETSTTANTSSILFKTLSSVDRVVMLNIMMENSNLRPNQIAANSFGFPMIPIPEMREHGGRVRLAPNNVSNQMLGHPIYWINPELSKYDEERESYEQWSIRMFYLILGFGYWTPNFEWIDYLEEKGFKWDSADVSGYHMQNVPICFADEYGFLEEKDLKVPLDRVMNSYKATMSQYGADLKKDVEAFLKKQMDAMVYARSILGDIYASSLDPSDAKSFWYKKVYPPLMDVSQQYNTCLETDGYISRLHDTVQSEFDKFRGLLVSLDYVVAMLTVPIVRSNNSASEAFGQMITHLGVSTAQASKRETGYDFTLRVEEVMSAGRKFNALNDLIFDAYELYRNCWRRMRLSVVNYDRMLKDESIFSSYMNLELFLVGDTSSDPVHTPIDEMKELASIIDEDWDL